MVREGNVLCLIFDDAATKNAIDDVKARALAHRVTSGALEHSIGEGNIGALVLTSAMSGVFASGGDVKKLGGMESHVANEMTLHMRAFCAALSTLPAPTFSLLCGPAYGGGAEIALATDFRVAGHASAALHLWQAKWAVPGGWHGMTRLSELCPSLSPRRVGLLFASARSLDKSELVRLGLCDAAFEAEPAAMDFILEFANGFSSCPRRLRSDFLGRINSVGTDEAMFARHWLGPEHRARLDAFKASRQGAAQKGSKT